MKKDQWHYFSLSFFFQKSKTSKFYQDKVGVPNPTCYQKHDLESPLPTSILVKKCLLCCSLQAFFSIQHDLWDSELLLLPLNNLVWWNGWRRLEIILWQTMADYNEMNICILQYNIFQKLHWNLYLITVVRRGHSEFGISAKRREIERTKYTISPLRFENLTTSIFYVSIR